MAQQTITICSTCASLDDGLKAEVERLKAQHGAQLSIIEVDCLDACDEYPVVQIDTRTIKHVTPDVLRHEAEKQASSKTR